MKKQYIQPTLEVVKMKYSTQLMAESLGVGYGTLSAEDALGREYDFDDEEEEY